MDTEEKTNNTEQSAYLFHVDILVEGASNALAAERLLHLLNKCGFPDFRIQSGLELGKLINALETAALDATDTSKPRKPETADDFKAKPDRPLETAASEQVPLMIDRVRTCISDNRLIRLSVNKGFGVRLNIPCRIIKLDESNQMLTVYHVDEKQVYTFSLNEIDDFVMQ